MRFVLVAVLLFVLPAAAHADCECRCVNGQVRPLCDDALDIAPICDPDICDLPPPDIRPIDEPDIPPLGTRSCSQEQVQNPETGEYEWQRVCQ